VHGPGCVYVNDSARFEHGVVDPADRIAVKTEIADVFSSITDPDTGEPVLDVYDGDDLFENDAASPDLIVPAPQLQEGADAQGRRHRSADRCRRRPQEGGRLLRLGSIYRRRRTGGGERRRRRAHAPPQRRRTRPVVPGRCGAHRCPSSTISRLPRVRSPPPTAARTRRTTRTSRTSKTASAGSAI